MFKKISALSLLLAMVCTFVFPVCAVSEGSDAVDDADPSVSYTGDWTHDSIIDAYDCTFSYANTAGDCATLTFEGNYIALLSSLENNRGIAEIFLDGESQGEIDLYSASVKRQQTVFEKSGLASGSHTVQVVVTGKQNPASAGCFVDVDCFLLTASESVAAVTFVDEQDSAVIYNGSWNHDNIGGAYSGTFSYSNQAGSSAEYGFSGTGISLICSMESNRGIAEIFLDGGSKGTVDLYSETVRRQVAVFTADGLESGSHTIRIVVTGSQNPASAGCFVDIDAFKVVDAAATSITTVYDETDDSAVYVGNWTHDPLPGAYNGTFSYSNEAGSSAEFTFNGIGISLICSMESNRGIAEIFLDGVSKGTVDLYSETARRQVTVFTQDDLANGSHTLRIVVTGSQNPAAAGCYVDIDAFSVKTPIAPEPRSFDAVHANDATGEIATEGIGAFVSNRQNGEKFDLRILFAAADPDAAVGGTVTVRFTKNGEEVFSAERSVSDTYVAGSTMKLYDSVVAGGQTYTGQGCKLFGCVITGIPADAFDTLTVTLTNGDDIRTSDIDYQTAAGITD
ncbi:MAG: hypothetical protein ACI3XR_02920 [Eubacteriales bacterium]